MYELLELWMHYTDIIYMPESQYTFMQMLDKVDLRPDNVTHKARMNEHDIQTRLNMLFGKDAKTPTDDQAADAAYTTVNEEETSDTTESGLDEDGILRRHEEYKVVQQQKAKDGDTEDTELGLRLKAAVEAGEDQEEEKIEHIKEGIFSSDEDEDVEGLTAEGMAADLGINLDSKAGDDADAAQIDDFDIDDIDQSIDNENKKVEITNFDEGEERA